MSVISAIDTIDDVQLDGHARLYIKRMAQLLGTIAVLGFFWSFVLPLIGLLIVTSRFFAG